MTDFRLYIVIEAYYKKLNCVKNFNRWLLLEKKSKNQLLSLSDKLGSFQKFIRANLSGKLKNNYEANFLLWGQLFRIFFPKNMRVWSFSEPTWHVKLVPFNKFVYISLNLDMIRYPIIILQYRYSGCLCKSAYNAKVIKRTETKVIQQTVKRKW